MSKYNTPKSWVDLMVEDARTIRLYLLILNFLKSILVIITTDDASIAIRNVMIFALSEVININHSITGKTWKSIANGWRVDTFSFAYAILLKGYVTYNQLDATSRIQISNRFIASFGIE